MNEKTLSYSGNCKITYNDHDGGINFFVYEDRYNLIYTYFIPYHKDDKEIMNSLILSNFLYYGFNLSYILNKVVELREKHKTLIPKNKFKQESEYKINKILLLL